MRSCLITELTASPLLRQTPHPTGLPPRTDAHAPLLHATFSALPPTHLWFAPLLRPSVPFGEWGRFGGLLPLNAASCWYLFAPRLTRSRTPVPRCHNVGRLVQNTMQTGAAVSGRAADSAAAAAADAAADAGRRDGG